MRKGQLSVEVVILLSALLIILMAVISSFSISSDSSMFNTRTASAREYSEELAYAINNVYLAGDGATQLVNLPSTLIDNTNYSITIYPQQHVLDTTWLSGSQLDHYSLQLLTAGLSGKLSGIKGSLNLTNSGGVIIIGN